jgi:hypothetical protein
MGERKFRPDIARLNAIAAELKRCIEALPSMVPSVAKADMMHRIDVLQDECARALGLPEDEIAKINEEVEGDDYAEIIEAVLGQKP